MMKNLYSLKTTNEINTFCKLLDDRETWNYKRWQSNDLTGLNTIKEFIPALYREIHNEYFKGLPRTKYNVDKALIVRRVK